MFTVPTATCSIITLIVYSAKINLDLQDVAAGFGSSVVKSPWLGPGCVIFILGVTCCIVAELLVFYAMMNKEQHGSEPAADHAAVGATESASDPLHSHQARYRIYASP